HARASATLALHDALPISGHHGGGTGSGSAALTGGDEDHVGALEGVADGVFGGFGGFATDLRVRSGTEPSGLVTTDLELDIGIGEDRKSTRLNSSHVSISY